MININENPKKSFSTIRYHLVFCPHYRRKIFLIDGLETRFRELVAQIGEQKNYEILSLDCGQDYCHLFLEVSPSTSAHDVMKTIKAATSTPLREEFKELSQMQVLWTRNFLASTAAILDSESIQNFIQAQRKR